MEFKLKTISWKALTLLSPMKERVVDEFYDPVLRLVRKIKG